MKLLIIPQQEDYVDFTQMPLYELARVVSRDWRKVYFGAVPYLEAMGQLNSIQDNYGYDTGKSVVLYFLANANTWKGETAKAVKAELKRRIK
jgi:hypothetical protein